MTKVSMLVSCRRWGRVPGALFLAYVVILIAVSAVCPGLDAAVNHSPLGYALIWVPFALCVAALLVMASRYVSLVGSAERLLDASCDPAALAARGDELGLADPVPQRGCTRIEAVLVQRWAVALVEVDRVADAAAARRRLEESLARRRRTGRSLYGASLCMLLADVSARFGDGEAAAAYAELFRDALARSEPGRTWRALGTVGTVSIDTAFALFAPGHASGGPGFSERDVRDLEVRGTMGRRLASEARLALAREASLAGDRDAELLLLAGASMAAPSVRAGALAAEALRRLSSGEAPSGTGLYASLVQAPAVDPHPAVLDADAAVLAGRPRGLRRALAAVGKAFLVVILALLVGAIVLNVLVALEVIRW